MMETVLAGLDRRAIERAAARSSPRVKDNLRQAIAATPQPQAANG